MLAVSPQTASLRSKLRSNDLKVLSLRPATSPDDVTLPGKSILRPERSSHATTAPNPPIDPNLLATQASKTQLNPAPSSASPPNPAPDATTDLTLDDEEEIIIRVALPSLKRRRKQSEQQLAAAKKEISDLRLVTAEGTRQLNEAGKKIEELKKAKEIAEDRWKTYKGQFKKVLQISRDANNRIEYLEKLLAFEERSGFSTLVSEVQLQ